MKKNVMGYTNAWTSQRDIIRDESPEAMCIYKRRRVVKLVGLYFPHTYKKQNMEMEVRART